MSMIRPFYRAYGRPSAGASSLPLAVTVDYDAAALDRFHSHFHALGLP